MTKLIAALRNFANPPKKLLMRTVCEDGDLIYVPIYSFGSYFKANTLLSDCNSSLFKDKIVGYSGNYTEHVTELDIGRSVYHFLQYIYIPTRYTM